MHIDRDACRKRWAPFAGSIKLHGNTEGFADVHCSGLPHSTEIVLDWQPCDGQATAGSSPPFPVRKSSFIRAIAFVIASRSLRCSGRKYPALMSFAIISVSLELGANSKTSLIGHSPADRPETPCNVAANAHLIALNYLTWWLAAIRRPHRARLAWQPPPPCG